MVTPGTTSTGWPKVVLGRALILTVVSLVSPIALMAAVAATALVVAIVAICAPILAVLSLIETCTSLKRSVVEVVEHT
jgi:hypothetical protein